MMAWTHIAFALFFYLLAAKLVALNFSFTFAATLALGSLLPDLDSARSLLARRSLIACFSAHRGFWHSIFGLLLFSLTALLLTSFLKLSSLYAAAIAAGCFLHLVADSFNPSGIRWFWKKGDVRGFIRTGSFGELLFFALLCIGIAWLLKSL